MNGVLLWMMLHRAIKPSPTSSYRGIKEEDTAGLQRFVPDFGDCEAFLLSRDPHEKRIGDVRCFPWQAGLQELGLRPREVFPITGFRISNAQEENQE